MCVKVTAKNVGGVFLRHSVYGIRKATLAVFSTLSLFLVTVTGRAAAPHSLRSPP